MGIRVALNHKTKYRYAKPVWLSPHVVRLRPAPHCRTPVVSYSLKVVPTEHFINWQQDPYSNRLARLVFPKKTAEFSIEVDLVADLTVTNPFDFFLEKYAEEYPFQYDSVLARELVPYLETAPPGPGMQQLARDLRKDKVRTVDYLVYLNQQIHSRVKYIIRLEEGIQTPEATLALRSGSCRDSAWLFVQLLRNLGLAARFVSGYLIQLAPDVKSLDGPSGTEKDVTDLHAWTEVYLPGAGWVGLDPTSGLLAGEGHVPLACSADPATAAAISGFFSTDDESVITTDPALEMDLTEGANGKVKDHFEFSMSVTRIHEDPRVTKPYTNEQWRKIEALGHQVDADLKAGDVRLTVGGEPTFVSVDDMDGAEWTTAALGPEKYRRASHLVRRLRDRFAPGGFLHHGQGKWYPGESLPRWTLGLFWRKDGEPVWRDPALVAAEDKPGRLTAADSLAFIDDLSKRLEVNPKHVLPGYEDIWYYLWKERRLPTNVNPLDNKLENPEDRARLARIFEQGLSKIVGYALPLRREYYTDGTSAWQSGGWFFRPEQMYLIPGDSPMGFRLPLDSIPWVSESEYPRVREQDPMAPRSPLPDRAAMSRQRYVAGMPAPENPQGFVEQILGPASGKRIPRRQTHPPDLPPLPGESAPWIIRTALCTEVRGSVLRVFMPPQHYLEDYLELVAAIEDTAANLGTPVLVEGYTPPHDPRITSIKVTPDPGVIEVNTSPVASWDDLVKNTEALYEEARLSRLGTEKFMLDGRHTGTGGGNHIVVGGACPSDSPLLRNPVLLRSLIGYWHNHPALSYLFSGIFVGPTSQAPRIDEARNDQVYEMEIAFKQIPRDKPAPPWLVDRIFRHLLVDVTGNTHRAEFCIDKLYSPDSSSGRLGLLEMRAFEMPPHARMSLTQHLLLESLVATFWKQPYRENLVRWRTEVHDRFMLPHFVRQDMEDVVSDLNRAGYPLELEWFAPHFEFRFPQYGTIEHRGITLELRQAIEPWNVLGEEVIASGTARYVDSSVERLQVLVNGMVDSRHIITCNGHRVPLHPTGTNGQFVSGVRYRAWQPPSCLHPTIGVHSPLVFDIYDKWSGRSIAGCTYHVTHPGGRSYERFPVNAYEAEARRMGRFFKFGHTPGPMSVGEEKISKEFPFTLDLRAQ
ncbi:MAG TPA: transglutaminase family protein [Candidatus Baltobacteraceae bacterium]|nr:transglutaminase family protein [Candidatus Baltobacteraceae bacterium]